MLSDPSSRRRLVLVVGVGIVLVVLIGVGVYGLLTGPPAAPSPSSEADTFTGTSSRPAAPPSPVTTTTAPPGDTLPSLPHTNDAVVYARAIAETLLAWDTMSRLTPDSHAQQVLDDADPAGRETPALAGDVANYLPTLEVWQQLRHTVAVARAAEIALRIVRIATGHAADPRIPGRASAIETRWGSAVAPSS